MEIKTERAIAYCILAILLVVGVVSYAAFPPKSPEDPVRIMFKSTAGNILFDHREHSSEAGYAYECADCHHMWEDDGEKPQSCSECHEIDSEDPINRADAFHEQCQGCHEDEGGGPLDCTECHLF